MVYEFLANGFEETEAITPVDLLVRGGLEVKLVSVTGEKMVTGSHGFKIEADLLFEEADFGNAELVILPGGMPGTNNLGAHKGLVNLLKERNERKERIAAICAAPMVFARNGILDEKKAICYPGCESELSKALIQDAKVVTDGHITTGMGPGTAMDFGIELLKLLKGEEISDQVAKAFLFKK